MPEITDNNKSDILCFFLYQRTGMLGKGMIHVLGGTGWDSVRFHHATQNGAQFKVYELFTSGIFLVIILDRG